MRVTLNGKEVDVGEGLTLQNLLEEMKIQSQMVACELNLKIVKRKEYSNTKINEGDRIEILQMIGGG